jgi:Ca2+-binding RTX toxin-like protein
MGAGNDFLAMEFADLTAQDTLAGGDGTDTLIIADNMDVGTLTKAAPLSSVSSFEKIQMADNTTLTLSDAAISSLGGDGVTVTRAKTGGNSTTVNALAVTQGNTTVTYDASSVTDTSDAIYIGSNAIDQFTGTKNADSVTIDGTLLKATDSFDGGAGVDTFKLDINNSSTTLTVEQTADTLAGISSFNNIWVSDDDNVGNKITLTLDDTFVDSNASSNALSILAKDASDGTASDDKVTIDASSVTSEVALTLTGGSIADKLIGGAGNDEINGGNDGDTLTGSGGKDDFNFSDTGGTVDTIKDLDLGTNTGSANVDQIDISGLVGNGITTAYSFAAAYAGGTATIIKDSTTADGAGTTGNAIAVLDNSTYATVADAEDALTTLYGAAGETDDAIVIWADSFNQVHISVDDNVGVDAGGLLDVAKLDGLTLSGVVSALDLGDIAIA